MAGYNTTQNRKITSRATISALALVALAFSGVAAAEQLYVNESGWWYEGGAFNASGTPIQAAGDAATAGDSIYVEGGNYYENVDVDKPRLTLEGAGADVVIVTAVDSGDHVFEVGVDWVNISGFSVTGATDYRVAGIYLENVDYCNISENNAYENDRGIYLNYSSDNTLIGNTVNSNGGRGICMSGSSNTLANNIASNNKYEGIFLYGSSSSSNTLANNTASNNDYGIYLYHSTSNTLANNTASNNDDGGIRLSFASGNILQNNIAKLNKKYGIHLFDSNSNTLANNIASNNGYDGIYLDCAFYLVISYNTLENNIVNSNNRYGVHLDGEADNNNITCNLVQNNMQRGFYLCCGCTNNNISYNNIIGNGNYNATGSGYEWQLYNGQSDDVNVANNWWGTNNEDQIIASIYDWNDNPKRGNATYLPILEQPAPCAPTPEESHTFTTTDAVIALQIAAGSRPPDLRWDVSGDGSVTSLDALMILHANAADSNT